MTLRDLITERIMFAVTEEQLMAQHHTTEEGLKELSDLDLFEIFESVYTTSQP